MPARKDTYWEQRFKSLKANNPSWGARRIREALQNSISETRKDGSPGERWIGNLIKRLKDSPTWLEEERMYRTFHWPESMNNGDLPWEASSSGLELLQFLDQETRGLSERPPVMLVKWFWKITQVIPRLAVRNRFLSAVLLSTGELYDRSTFFREIEWWLAYQPWEGETQKSIYTLAVSRPDGAIPKYLNQLYSQLEKDIHELLEGNSSWFWEVESIITKHRVMA
ncbi:MAG: hypothetical protein DK304_000784 [Chloroflexi bacterium]|jgi:hypothetical protein|nr:MAG: hypothetical protein DK304_000784 [Chloroflexota bacterium]